VTIVLMGIVLPITMRALSVALAASATARHQVEAATLAQQKLNEMLAAGGTAALGVAGDFGDEWPQYRWTCQSVTDSIGFTQVTMSVTWQHRGRERAFNLTTVVAP
jgi:hypothetical protein